MISDQSIAALLARAEALSGGLGPIAWDIEFEDHGAVNDAIDGRGGWVVPVNEVLWTGLHNAGLRHLADYLVKAAERVGSLIAEAMGGHVGSH